MSAFIAARLKALPKLPFSPSTLTSRFHTFPTRHAIPHPTLHRLRLLRPYATAATEQAISTAAPQAACRSLPIRFLRTIGLAIIFIPVGFAMATVPVAPAVNGLLNPPTDAETLELFTPYNERCAEIDAHIKNHPIAQELRQNQDMTESRPYLKIPTEAQDHHLTSGALGGEGKLWVPPLHFIHKEGKEAVILIYLGKDICGHKNIIHGGMLATLLDEGLARTCFPALPNKVGMTATLTVDYKAPTPADSFVVMRATTTKVEGRKAWVEGRIEQMDVEEGKEAVVFARATGLFVEPRQAATMAKLYPVAAS